MSYGCLSRGNIHSRIHVKLNIQSFFCSQTRTQCFLEISNSLYYIFFFVVLFSTRCLFVELLSLSMVFSIPEPTPSTMTALHQFGAEMLKLSRGLESFTPINEPKNVDTAASSSQALSKGKVCSNNNNFQPSSSSTMDFHINNKSNIHIQSNAA